MSNAHQIIITSDLDGHLWNVCICDLFTGTVLHTYKGNGVVGEHCLALVGGEYLIASQRGTPIIRVWPLGSGDQFQKKITCPGIVTALSVTHEGTFCLVAISEKIYIWETFSGSLLAILSKHYNKVTCIKVSSDSSHFISAGDDGHALVWSFAKVFANCFSGQVDVTGDNLEPLHRWTHHTRKITDVHIGLGGLNARCATCSLDRTCKIYELLSGKLMTTIVFDTPLWSVVMDPAEYFLFVGGENGHIYETKLYLKSIDINETMHEKDPVFLGHSSAVTSLSVSIDGQALISGSNDKNLYLWHIKSKQLMRTNQHKGPISNAIVCLTPLRLNSDLKNSRPTLPPIANFKRNLVNDAQDRDTYSIEVKNNADLAQYLSLNAQTKASAQMARGISKGKGACDSVVREDIDQLKKINEKIYNYALEEIFKPIE